MKKVFISIIILLAISGFGFWLFSSNQPEDILVSETVSELPNLIDKSINIEKDVVEEGDSIDDVIEDRAVDRVAPESVQSSDVEEKEVETVQAKVVLDVPFFVQAPFADWSMPFKEACEEASSLMLHAYLKGITDWEQERLKQEILGLSQFSDTSFDKRIHTTAAETAMFFTNYLDYSQNQVQVVYDITIDDIKGAIAKGYPVIVPAAGRELGNVNFRTPGPIYHMLVVTGYNQRQFITNDPGTRNGEGYLYDQEVLFNAIHDWTGSDETILEGRKAMIIVTPSS